MKKIVILGGGTAGWLTALYAKHLFDKAEVTLVESSEIGILGAVRRFCTNDASFLTDITDTFRRV